MALAVAGGNLLVPETIHWVLDLGILADGVRMGRVVLLSSISILLVGGSILLGKATYYRLLRTMENLLMGLRVQTFTHLHRLSLAEHTASRKGALVARVTSDVASEEEGLPIDQEQQAAAIPVAVRIQLQIYSGTGDEILEN